MLKKPFRRSGWNALVGFDLWSINRKILESEVSKYSIAIGDVQANVNIFGF
jgi:hypothetical protein